MTDAASKVRQRVEQSSSESTELAGMAAERLVMESMVVQAL